MTDEKIIENYKKYCPNLKSADLMLRHEYQAVQELEEFIKNKTVESDDVIKAFKMANESKFLTGKVNDFQADIRWICNPVNIDKVLSGKYNDKPKQVKASFDYSSSKEKELELEQHERNQKKLEVIRNDKEHQEWLESEWYAKYPNMRI